MKVQMAELEKWISRSMTVADRITPVPLPRRMWAGSRLQFVQPLRIGESVERVSRII